jgi:hypothetical protein
MKLIFESGNLSKMVRSKLNSFKAKHQVRLKNGRFAPRSLWPKSHASTPKVKQGYHYLDRIALVQLAKANPLSGEHITPKPAAIEKNPLVTFDYPKSDAPWQIWQRCVRLISADATHYTGLEQTSKGWKYKKFLASEARHFKVVSFNSMAMS